MPKSPDDATRDALELIARDGSDLTRPLSMDFFVAVPDEKAGRFIADRVIDLGFGASVERDAETGKWTCYCTKNLVPAYETVVAIESELDLLARRVGGYADGFGTFGNADAATEK